MIFGAVLRSPHAHAKIKNIDTSKAENMNGVFVMTAKDLLDLQINREEILKNQDLKNT